VTRKGEKRKEISKDFKREERHGRRDQKMMKRNFTKKTELRAYKMLLEKFFVLCVVYIA
jgi:hypothetical protein